MIEFVREVLEKEEYKKIPSNIPFVSLYVKYIDSDANVIQLIECEEKIQLTVQQFEVFCDKSESFMKAKGIEKVDLISIVVTGLFSEARKFVLGERACWIIDSENGRLAIFDNQPDDFDGLRAKLEDAISKADISQVNITQENNAQAGSVQAEKAYKSTVTNRNHSGSSSDAKGFSDEFTLVNTILVAINVVIFIILSIFGSTEDVDYMIGHGAMFVPAIVEDGEYYRFITCMFLHFGFMHLSGNMVVLLFLGDNVERVVGKIRYLLIYFLGGIIGSIGSFTYAYIYNQGMVSAGASGAIFALIGGLLWFVIKNKGRLENMTTLKMCVLIAYALYSGFTSENVDMAAHIFGLAGGFLVAIIVTAFGRKPILIKK